MRCILPLLAFAAVCAAPASAQSRSITFRVDVSYQAAQGRFDPATESVDVAGTFNGWGGSPLTPLADPDGDLVYEVTRAGFSVGQTIEFKFRFNGRWDGREEFPGGGPNRTYTVAADANVIHVWYNDEAPPTGPPVAAFTAVPTVLSEGGVVSFTDRSGGLVTGWAWTFPGGVPAASTERHPVVRYAQAGTYDVTLVATGPEGADTLAAPGHVEVRPRPEGALSWWNDTVFYEVFVRSFYDSDGDGIGDFNGLTAKLDYLNDGDPTTTDDLGVTGIWLMPISASPSYHGYDVTDYRSIEPDYGTMDDFRRFLDAAHARGIRVIVDFVMNHSSSQHPWFQAARQNVAPYRDYYRWSTTRPGYQGPWGQEVWHGQPGNYYYGLFWSGMPDLNFAHPPVRDSLFAAADFWLQDVGVDGFRLDAVKYIFEDGAVLENVPATFQFWNDFSAHVATVAPDAYTVCEAWSNSSSVVPYLTDGGLDSCFEFDLATAMVAAANTGDARGLAARMQQVYDAYPHLQYATFLTNHDQDRVMSVLGQNEAKARTAAALLLTLPGIPYLYYGEEIGMLGTGAHENIRRPMQWTSGPHAGFSTTTPWIAPGPNYATHNVAAGLADPGSLLGWYRRLIHLRTGRAALRVGHYHAVTSSAPSVAAFLRSHGDEVVLVVVNTGATAQTGVRLGLPPGLVAPGTYVLDDLLADGPPATATVTGAWEIEGVALGAHAAQVFVLAGSTDAEPPAAPAGTLTLDPARPNPARASALVAFHLPAAGTATLEVFNALGQRVWSLAGDYAAGSHTVEVNTSALAAGVYTVRLRQGEREQSRRLTVVR